MPEPVPQFVQLVYLKIEIGGFAEQDCKKLAVGREPLLRDAH
jgi:hypothetical protein